MVSVTTISSHIGRHKNTVLLWAQQGLIPCVRRNKRVVNFDLEQVLAAMKHHNLKPGARATLK